jgi:putative hydrolase of the HAD superfamily
LEEVVGRPVADREGVRLRRLERHHALIAENDIRPGVRELLDDAVAHGIPAAVASSSDSAWVGGHLERLGVLDRFAAVVTRDDVARAKPWPDLYLEACRRLAADPSLSVAFEDSHNGLLAAKAAGLRCIVVPNDITAGQDFTAADDVLPTLPELAYLRRRIGRFS